MLHPTDQNQQNLLNRSIKLQSNLRSEPVARTLKSTLVNYKDSISHVKPNELGQNSSMTLDRKESGTDNSSQKLDKMIAHQKELNNNWNKQIQNQRQSLLATSRQIKRISTEFDQTIHRSNQKSFHFSQNKAEFRTPVLKKDESQFTRTSQNIPNDSLSFQEKSNYQMKIQQLMNKVQFLENQCRNLRNQNDNLHRSLGAPKQILQRQIENKNFRIDDVEKRLAAKNKQYLDKCVENQKNLAKVTDLEAIIRRLESQKQKVITELGKSNQNGITLSKSLNESRAATTKIENEKKKVCNELEGQKLKVANLEQDKKQLQLELQKISKIKQLVREMEQSDSDKAEVIKKHIAYEAQLIELNGVMVSNLESHKHDLKVTSDQHNNINNEIQSITQQIAVKMKDVLDQKQRLEDELAEARAETQKIRKTMFIGYQEIIAKLKDEIIQLKEENVNLSNNSQSKITIVKLERQIKLLETKNEDLMGRHKDMEATIQKLQASELRRTSTDISSQTSIKGPEYYDRTGKADLQSIIMNYETRTIQLNSRIKQKQIIEIDLKRKIEQFQNELQQYKDQAQLSNRKQKSDSDNIKAKLQSMKMQLKSETDSLNRKIEGLQKNILRKNKEIKEKDSFITNYLIQKVKDQINVSQIVQQIDKFFVEAN